MSKYVDNDVFRFSINLKLELINTEVTIYTKPFPSKSISFSESDEQEQLVQDKYFTKERINELKEQIIKKIKESDDPLRIYCSDRDSGYNVTEDQLFNLED